MAQNDLETRHLETLDRDLGRFSYLENAASYVSRPLVGPGIAFVFIIRSHHNEFHLLFILLVFVHHFKSNTNFY